MENDNLIRGYYTQNPQAPTPVVGTVVNEVRIQHETIKSEVTKSGSEKK